MAYFEEFWYDTALVCLNRHVVNDEMIARPAHNASHCSVCGAATISACPQCHEPIRGYYHSGVAVFFGHKPKPPAYCHGCRTPYPWTKARLEAAQEMARELHGLDERERELLAASLPDLMIDGPRTELAATRAKRLVAKAGPAGKLIYQFILDFGAKVAVEMMKS